MKVDAMKQGDEFGIFSFFTGAGFLDLGFEDAGGGVEGLFFSRRDEMRRRSFASEGRFAAGEPEGCASIRETAEGGMI